MSSSLVYRIRYCCCAGDSNSASAARAAIAVLASQQSAHSLPEQMRQKLVGLVDDRISHLQSPCPPDPAAGFVAGGPQPLTPRSGVERRRAWESPGFGLCLTVCVTPQNWGGVQHVCRAQVLGLHNLGEGREAGLGPCMSCNVWHVRPQLPPAGSTGSAAGFVAGVLSR